MLTAGSLSRRSHTADVALDALPTWYLFSFLCVLSIFFCIRLDFPFGVVDCVVRTEKETEQAERRKCRRK